MVSARRRVERSVVAAIMHTVALNFRSDPEGEEIAQDLKVAIEAPFDGLSSREVAKLCKRSSRLHSLIVQPQLNNDLVKVFIAYALLLRGLQDDGRLPEVVTGSAFDRGYRRLLDKLADHATDARWASGEKQARRIRRMLEQEGYFVG
jgi:hypothetical protein